MKALKNSDVNYPQSGFEVFQGPFLQEFKNGRIPFCSLLESY